MVLAVKEQTVEDVHILGQYYIPYMMEDSKIGNTEVIHCLKEYGQWLCRRKGMGNFHRESEV